MTEIRKIVPRILENANLSAKIPKAKEPWNPPPPSPNTHTQVTRSAPVITIQYISNFGSDKFRPWQNPGSATLHTQNGCFI